MEVRLHQQPDGAVASRMRRHSASVSPTDSDSSPTKRLYRESDEAEAAERAADSDCESDTSEVLSVGHEPPPALTELEESTRGGSRSPSPAGSAGLSQPASSPGASSVRSPASSSVAASSPGPEPRYLAQPGLLDYPRLSAGHGLGHEIVYPSVERLSSHRAPIRLSFSPPSAMTVPGLQVATPILHPSACREPPTLGLGHPLQHALAGHLQPLQQMAAAATATTVHQHRLSVNKILQRDEPNSPRDEQAHQAQQAQQMLLNGSSRSSDGHPGDAHGNNASSNNNNNSQHQASLKFSIDNILKADFGRRITDPISLKKSRPQRRPASRPIDLSKDFLESSSEGSERGSESSTRNVSPSLPASSPAPNPATPASGGAEPSKMMQWPAWVYCTRYSDRPSSGPRTRRPKRATERPVATVPEEKRPRTAFSPEQLARLKHEFGENKYLNEQRRQSLSKELGLNEAQIKIWFQNKRAKIKKASGQRNPLALQLMAQGLYNHSTVPLSKEEMEQAAELQAK